MEYSAWMKKKSSNAKNQRHGAAVHCAGLGLQVGGSVDIRIGQLSEPRE
jgi:hypothetical protein